MVQRSLSGFRPTEVMLTQEIKSLETRSEAENNNDFPTKINRLRSKDWNVVAAYLYLWTMTWLSSTGGGGGGGQGGPLRQFASLKTFAPPWNLVRKQ